MNGLKTHLGAISKTCVPSAAYNSLQLNNTIPASACNTKFVYDSSDYVTFLKQAATARNYNDLTYGGDDYKASQSAIRAIRRY